MSSLMGIIVFLFAIVFLSTAMMIWGVVKPRVMMAIVAMRMLLPSQRGVKTQPDKKTDIETV